MRALLAPAAALLALAGPVALTPQASAESTTLKAVIFEEVKPLYQKTDAGYEGLGVDVLEQIRIQAKRRKVDYRVAKSVNDGIGAVITGKADIACGVAFTWGRSTQVTYSLPFGIGGTRLLMASDRYGSFNLGNLKDLSLVESTHTEQFRRLMADMTSGVDTCHKGLRVLRPLRRGQRQQQILGTRHPRLQRNQRLPLRHSDADASAVGAL